MRNKIYIFIFFLLLFCIDLYSQQNWYWQNPRPQGNPLFNIKTFDDQNAFAVGTVGTTVRTTNGGLDWTVNYKSGQSDEWLWATYFFNSYYGFAVGGGGNIFRMEGNQYTKIYSGTRYTLQSIFFLNYDIGWIAGWQGTILKTTDRGENWLPQIPPNAAADLYSISFINENIGFCVGVKGVGTSTLGEVLKTSNGGATWETVDLGYNNRLWGVNFRHGVGWIYGWGGLMLKSTDNGATWVPKNRLMPNSIYSIDFPTENIGYAAGETGILLKSTDAGETWFDLNSGTEDTIYSINFYDERIGFFVGENGIIFKTTDGGQHWTEQSNGLTVTTKWLTATDFINRTGWAVGEKGTILKTTDNGVTWRNLSKENITTDLLNDIQFPSLNIGYIAGQNGTVLQSTDAGETWRNVAPTGSTQNFTDLHFINDDTGFLANRNRLLKTTNGGNSWTELPTISGISPCQKIFFLNSDTGWVVGLLGSINKTTNGGESWVRQNSPASTTLFDVKFINENIGWISGDDGLLLRTTNGGNNWQQITIAGWNDEITTIFANDYLNVWAVGKWGTLLKSTNGGVNWTRTQTITSNFLSGLYFSETTSGLVFGKGGTIIRYREGPQTPFIGISDNNLIFNAFQGGPLPPSQNIYIFNSEAGTLNWSTLKNASWLNVTPTSGTNSANVTFSVNTTNIAIGTYYDSVSVIDPNASNSPQKIYITYNLFEPGKQPIIDLGGVTDLYFEADQNGPLPPQQSFMVRNTGGSELTWKAVIEEPWIDLLITSGNLGEGQFIFDSIGVNTTNLKEGVHNTFIDIESPVATNSPQRLNINYKIYSDPKFVIEDSIVIFYATQNGAIPEPQYVFIDNTGRTSYNWNATKNAEWFDFNPKSGTDKEYINIEITSTNYPVGDRTGIITLTSSGAENSPATITVILRILPEALISMSPQDSVVFTWTEIGETRDTTLTITNIGTNALEISSFAFYGNDSLLFRVLNENVISINPGNQRVLTFRFSPMKIGVKKAELRMVTNVFSINNGLITIPFIGYAKDTRPPDIIIVNTIEQPINYGDSIMIQSTATDLSGIREFDLWYRNSNQDWNQSRKRPIPLPINGIQYIPASIVRQQGVDFRITAEDSAGNLGVLKNMNNPNKPITFTSISVRLNNKNLIGSTYSINGGTTKAAHRMFSSPIIFDYIRAKDFWGYLGEYLYQWRFRVPIDKLENWEDGEEAVIQSGVSYFIITRHKSTVSGHTGNTVKFEELHRDGVQLEKGFNYIGNPFTFEVPNNKISFTDQNQIFENNSWYYAGNYQWLLREPWRVWAGYCVYAEEPTQMIIDEVITNNSFQKQEKVFENDDWEIQITATDGELFDMSNYIGMKLLASDNFDKYDFRKPPHFEGGLSLIFPHEDWNDKSGNYAGDYRTLNSSGAVWNVKILSEKDKTISLEFIKSSNFPNNFSIKLFDTDYLKYLTIIDNKISFNTSGEKNLKLIIGTESFFNEEDPKLENIVPKSFSLFQNYPNPFNSRTNIFYHLPQDGKVILEIYSILGSKVKTLVNQFQQSGTHEVSFDAKDLASGIYFYKLSVDGSKSFSAVKKMILMK